MQPFAERQTFASRDGRVCGTQSLFPTVQTGIPRMARKNADGAEVSDFGVRRCEFLLENRRFRVPSAFTVLPRLGSPVFRVAKAIRGAYDCRLASIRRFACEQPGMNFLELIEYRLTYVPNRRTSDSPSLRHPRDAEIAREKDADEQEACPEDA